MVRDNEHITLVPRDGGAEFFAPDELLAVVIYQKTVQEPAKFRIGVRIGVAQENAIIVIWGQEMDYIGS